MRIGTAIMRQQGQPRQSAMVPREQGLGKMRPSAVARNIPGTVEVNGHTLRIVAPIRIVGEQNSRGSWQIGNRRHKAQRNAIAARLAMLPARLWLQAHEQARYVVTFTRIGKRELDNHDNLRAGFKHCADAIARALKVDDADSRIRFEYARQVKGDYGVIIIIEALPAGLRVGGKR